MKKYVYLIFLISSIFISNTYIFASSNKCSLVGGTVVYVNGILTDKQKARDDTFFLAKEFGESNLIKNVNFLTGYNPSHLAGVGDLIQSVSQVLLSPVSTFDRDTILQQIHSKITTQKILLVGHSQGTFYTNELYEYLIDNGVPEESIAVYNMATPASFVSGGGEYLTSTNDNLIKKVRELAIGAGVPEPLPANETILISNISTKSLWQGHSFVDEYLAGAPVKIVSDIYSTLDNLKSRKFIDVNEGCFNPPPITFSYKIKDLGFSIIDPLVNGTVKGLSFTSGTLNGVSSVITNSFASAINFSGDLISGIILNFSKPNLATKNNSGSVVLAVGEDGVHENYISTEAFFDSRQVIVSEPEVVVLEPEIKPMVELITEEEIIVIEPEEPVEKEVEKAVIFDTTAPIPGYQPGFGGGGGAPPPPPPPAPEPDLPSAPVITSPASFDIEFSTTTITFLGTAQVDQVISHDFSTSTATVAGDGTWSISLKGFAQGTTTINFFTTENSKTSSTTAVDVGIDTVAPSLDTFVVLQCSYSLTTAACLSGTTTLNLSWTSSSTDIVSFKVYKDNTLEEITTSTSTNLSISDGGSSSLEVSVTDGAGNVSTSTAQTVSVKIMPLVINEIAWAGTEASSADEWIEIYNRTTDTIDLSNVKIVSTDGVPLINLSGTIAATGYYLVERTDDNATSVDADLAVVFSGVGGGSGLSNTQETLSLIHALGGFASSTLDSTPTVSSCGGSWCGGTNDTNPFSMERVDPDVSGSTASNWKSNNGYTRNSTDSGSNSINGTPKAQNSVNLKTMGYFCPDETSTFISGGYYTPTSGACTYLSSEITGAKYGDIYRGVVASSTIVNGHLIGTGAVSVQNDDSISGGIQGEDFFAAIYELRIGPAFNDLIPFRDFFKTGNTAPPHLNYGVLEWKYGVEP